MNNMNTAIERIKSLECPTGELENRVAGIIEDYGISIRSKVNIHRVRNLDRDEAQAYQVQIAGEEQSVIVLARSGLDDYVARVVDVYSE